MIRLYLARKYSSAENAESACVNLVQRVPKGIENVVFVTKKSKKKVHQ